MSATHEPAWYDGFSAGYGAAEDDLIEWISETLDEWRTMRAFTHQELWASRDLLAHLELRRASARDTE